MSSPTSLEFSLRFPLRCLPATSYSAFFLFFALGSIPTCSCLASLGQDIMPENRNASGSGRIKQIREQGESTINSQINLASPTQKFKFHAFRPLRVEVLTPYTKTCLSWFSGCDRLDSISDIFNTFFSQYNNIWLSDNTSLLILSHGLLLLFIKQFTFIQQAFTGCQWYASEESKH